MALLSQFNYGASKNSQQLLKITIPEDLNYEDAFDEILQKFATHYELINIKTMDLGSLYRLDYAVTIDKETNPKEFLDALRVRNGNLNINLSMYSREAD